MNDTNTDSDGPTWIQTATGGDKPRTAGGTPTTDSLTNLRATEAKRGRQEKHESQTNTRVHKEPKTSTSQLTNVPLV